MTKETWVATRLPTLTRTPWRQIPRGEGEGGSLCLTPRDERLIATAYEYRVADSATLAALFFSETASGLRQAQQRLLRLWQAGYLERGEIPVARGEGSKPYIYWIGRLGAELVAAREAVPLQELDWRPSAIKAVAWPHLDHVLAVGRVRAAVTLAAERNQCSVDLWIGDAELKKRQEYVELEGPNGKMHRTAFVPDGFMALRSSSDLYHGFWEVDRGGLTGQTSKWQRRSWFKKVKSYLAYYYSRAFENEYGTSDMRLFTVTTGTKRLENLRAVTEKAGGGGRFWFATLDEVDPARILTKPIWSVAGQTGKRAIVED